MEKQAVLLFASPRPNGNTASLLPPLLAGLSEKGVRTRRFSLYDLDLRPCLGCRACQRDHSVFGCCQADSMAEIFDAVLQAQLLILATPIYSWYCTPPLKAVLDRLVYGMNKFYGETRGPSLWAGRSLALLTTCGYRPEKGADLFIEGMRRYCKHSGLVYAGDHCERHLGYDRVFFDEEKGRRALDFGRALGERISGE